MPSVTNLHPIDVLLTNFAKEYKNNEYVGLQLMPIYPVSKLSDAFTVYYRQDSMSVPETTMGARSRARTIDWRFGTDTYSCQLQAVNIALSQIEKDNSDIPEQQLRLRNTGMVQDQLLLRLEYEQSSLLTTTGTFGSNFVTLSGTDQWNYAGAGSTVDILSDIDTARAACAKPPTHILFGSEVWDIVKRDASLISLIKDTRIGLITPQVISELFDIPNVIIAKSQYSDASGNLSYLWGKHVVLAHVERPGPSGVMLGATFSTSAKHVVRTWLDPAVGGGSEFIEVNWNWDLKIVATDCGYLINDAIA